VNDGDEVMGLAHFSRDALRSFQRAQWRALRRTKGWRS
jgi:hypothetical protein